MNTFLKLFPKCNCATKTLLYREMDEVVIDKLHQGAAAIYHYFQKTKSFSVCHADHLRWTNTMESQPKSEYGTSENFNSTILHDEATKETHWAAMPVFIAVFLTVLVLLTTTGNLVICRLFWVCRRMRIPSFYFVVSMSFSDFLMGVLVIPVSLAYHMTFQTTGNKYDCL